MNILLKGSLDEIREQLERLADKKIIKGQECEKE